MKSEEFYIGYLDSSPTELGRWLRRIVPALLVAAAFLAGFWVAAARPFDPGVFEFGAPRSFTGIVIARPYPSLVVERPGDTRRFGGFSRYWLVGDGKHGADDQIEGFDGKAVELSGDLLYRDGQTMIKLNEGAIKLLPADGADHFGLAALDMKPRPLGAVDVQGEIIDPQCFLGIMKPGYGMTHRSCAIRCLSGGVPPVLRALDGAHTAHYYLLLGPDGGRINRQLLPVVAEPLKLHGEAYAYGDFLALQIDPRTLLTH